ncbi:hypothetical protein Vqi01_10050 [Micromonospora qiuiae]|uniref:Uncharacterized protein n=1 Tax=Micromonospora qiuiae TaxID=502268 RepID=A0ABQ4J6P1_9ACTN|nr:hypothetical protein [Micromonospora qiuiae]GIJ25843.1 hypothetical protein Vqi01_10050 [Micromonospora qiuiae]
MAVILVTGAATCTSSNWTSPLETVIVMPGAITEGTEHFANASRASDQEVAAAYADLDPLVERNHEATAGLLRHPPMAAGVVGRLGFADLLNPARH